MKITNTAGNNMKVSRPLNYIAATSILVLTALGAQSLHANNAVGPVSQDLVETNINDGFSQLVKATRPAVVNIVVKSKQPIVPSSFNGQPDAQEFMKRFFGDQYQMKPQGKRQEMPQRQSRGVGSGFIIDASGYVVTNHHVIKGATEIQIVLSDGTELEAELKGADPKTDLALLKIKQGSNYPYVKFGDSAAADVGDWVMAMGNPFGLGGTTTKGIISARGRSIGAGPLDDFIQIDAPINRGNSGGPLFNMKGEVIGVNSAIYSPNGGSVGIGFEIPASMAEHVIGQIKDTGSVQRGMIGVNIQKVDDDIAASLGLDDATGVLVARVVDDSPAAAAKIQSGDIILTFDGKVVDKMRDLPKMVAKTNIGKTVDITVWRDEAVKTLSITIGKSPDSTVTSSLEGKSSTEKLGLKLSKSTDGKQSGILVAGIQPDSIAAEQGLSEGDVIKKIGKLTVSKPADLALAIDKATKQKRRSVLLFVQKDDQSRYIALPIGKLQG